MVYAIRLCFIYREKLRNNLWISWRIMIVYPQVKTKRK